MAIFERIRRRRRTVFGQEAEKFVGKEIACHMVTTPEAVVRAMYVHLLGKFGVEIKVWEDIRELYILTAPELSNSEIIFDPEHKKYLSIINLRFVDDIMVREVSPKVLNVYKGVI